MQILPSLASLRQLVLAGVVLGLGAVPGGAADRAEIREFLNVTGFDVAISSVRTQIKDAPVMLGLPEDAFTEGWQSQVSDLYEEEKLQDLALSMLEPTLSDDMREEAIEFYGSDLGQRFVAVENASHAEEADPADEAKGEDILDEASEARRDALERLTDGIDAQGVSARAVQDIQVRFLMAASGAGLLEVELDEAMLRAQMAAGYEALRAELRAANLAHAARVYQGFSDEEIARYADALGEPEMQKVYELLNAVQYEVMANRLERLAPRLAKLRQGQDI
ncbi:DUF2059 domain-containing protein [Roseovarius sp. C7]|uniref:DUF2059 domain-containing protein n=1 Tax=Roseovarius sp. C7 TaxID=3398643 RepID=UPI0039F5DCDD